MVLIHRLTHKLPGNITCTATDNCIRTDPSGVLTVLVIVLHEIPLDNFVYRENTEIRDKMRYTVLGRRCIVHTLTAS